jgi:L-iditol 2-dehydrogenase
MGLIAAGVARAQGAFPVIVAGATDHRLALAGKSFADVVIDVRTSDLSKIVLELTEGRGADIVVDSVEGIEPLRSSLGAVRRGGTVNIFAGVPNDDFIEASMKQLHYGQVYLTGSYGTRIQDFHMAVQLFEANRVDFGSLVTASFSIEDTSDALAYSKECRGLKAVVQMNQDS